MKLNNRIALTFVLSAALFSASALAQDAAPAKKAHMKKTAGHGVVYDTCLKQKLAVAEYFCSIPPDTCQSEKDGAASQCRSEARGERQKG